MSKDLRSNIYDNHCTFSCNYVPCMSRRK